MGWSCPEGSFLSGTVQWGFGSDGGKDNLARKGREGRTLASWRGVLRLAASARGTTEAAAATLWGSPRQAPVGRVRVWRRAVRFATACGLEQAMLCGGGKGRQTVAAARARGESALILGRRALVQAVCRPAPPLPRPCPAPRRVGLARPAAATSARLDVPRLRLHERLACTMVRCPRKQLACLLLVPRFTMLRGWLRGRRGRGCARGGFPLDASADSLAQALRSRNDPQQ